VFSFASRGQRPFALALLILLSSSVAVLGDNGSPVADAGLWGTGKIPEFIAVLLLSLVMVIGVIHVRRRGRPQLRPLPPIAAVDDAIGRATEQGTAVIYTTGWGGDMSRPTIMASMEILGSVASRAARNGCRLLVPSHDPVIVGVAQDTISQSATVAGRPDWFASSDVTFVTQSQFGYASAFAGLVARHHPGSVFLIGTFEGEALILAEAAHDAGAVTIAGTDSTIQLSFFLVACDYTLIGEELFAAAAMVSGDEHAAAAVLAQDMIKYLILLLLLIGGILVGFGFNLNDHL